MSLRIVEFVMDVEEAFGIELSEDDCDSIRTVGDLIGLVCASNRGAVACLTQRAFYRIRRACAETIGMDRCEIAPATTWASVVRRGMRRRIWRRIRMAAGVPLPDLVCPRVIQWAFRALPSVTVAAWIYVVALFSAGVPILPGSSLEGAIGLGSLCIAIVGSALTGLSRRVSARLANAFDPQFLTVWDSSVYAATQAGRSLKKASEGWALRDVERILGMLLRRHFGVSEFTRDSNFVRDFDVAGW